MQQTLAQLVRAKYPGAYDDLSDQQLETSVRAKFPGVYDDLPVSGAKPEKPKDRQSGLATLGDFVIGALKGGGETALNLGALLHKIPGVSGVVDSLYGQEGLSDAAFQVGRANTQPTNTAQRIGKGTEQFAELLVGGGAVGAATKGLKLGARVAAEGAAGAGMNAAQGQSATAGGVMGAAGPVVGAGIRGARSLLRGAGATPVVRDAVEWGARQGIPIDAATASGAPIVRAIQGAADATPLGGVVAAQARNQTGEALTATGQRLAGQVAPSPQTMVSAGESIQGTLGQLVKQASAEADQAYGRLRAIESRSGAPKNVTTIPTNVSPKISDVVASKPGTKFADLAPEEQAAIKSLQAEIGSSTFERGTVIDTAAGEFSGGAVGKGYKSSSRSSQSYQNQEGSNLLKNSANADAFRDVGGSLSGAKLDTRLQEYIGGGRPSPVTDRALRVAQRMMGLADDLPTENPLSRQTGSALGAVSSPAQMAAMQTRTTDILRAVENELGRHGIRRGTPQYEEISGQVPELLRIVGSMRDEGATVPEVLDAVKNGVASLMDFEAPSLSMVVDLGQVQQRLAPVYQKMLRSSQLAQPMGAEAVALKAADRLMNVQGQHAPLSVVDDALSDLKSALRKQPDLGKGTGALRSTVAILDKQVMDAARRAGPEAVDALQVGRAATIRKYVAADIAERLGDEPARVAGKLTARADTAIGSLRELAVVAPKELPKIGRAVLDDLLETATQEGGFKRADGLFQKWQALGEQTKTLLFKPETKRDLDRFFLLAKRLNESPNPSQSGTFAMTAGSTALVFTNPLTGVPLVLGAGALSKLLHSTLGVRAVTTLMSTPPTSAQYASRLQNVMRAVSLEASQAGGGGSQ